MAKGKKKTSSKNGRLPAKGGSQYGSSDDESLETCSVFSGDSAFPVRGSQDNTDEDAINSGPDEIDSFEDKLREALDGASSAKSAQRRTQCFQALCKAFGERYYPEFLAARPTTMADLIEKGLKKGKGDEQARAATLAATLVLQYGAATHGTELFQTLSKILTTLLYDNAVPPQVREKMALALTITAYMAEVDPFSKQEILDHLRAVFAGSFLKGDGVTPNVTPPMSSLHQTALLCWSLMLTAYPFELALENITKNLRPIAGLLQCTDVEMRVTAGEALAVMYELARSRIEDFEGDDMDELCETLHQLATDSQKFRAKKDRKMQKSSFRDIEKAIRDSEGPELNIQFGVETLKIRTWEEKRTYDALCFVLGSGMNHHLQNNPEVRNLFHLGDPLLVTNVTAPKITKFEKHMGNMLADRNRTKWLNKARDKRGDFA